MEGRFMGHKRKTGPMRGRSLLGRARTSSMAESQVEQELGVEFPQKERNHPLQNWREQRQRYQGQQEWLR